MRTDLGYDAIVLAIEDRGGVYQAYLLGDQYDTERWIFQEADSNLLKEKAKKWCEQHLSSDRKMVQYHLKTPSLYKPLKAYLQENKIPYEFRQQSFFVVKLYMDEIYFKFTQ